MTTGTEIVLMGVDEAREWKANVARAAKELRELLWFGYEREAWRALGYSNWTECLQALAEEFALSERHLWRLHEANKSEVLLTHGSVGKLNERQLRPLTSLEPDEQIEVWEMATETAPPNGITGRHVQKTVEVYKNGGGRPHVANNSGNNEWYTPPEYVEAARAVMGSIDLDPASSDIANNIIGAATYYTANDDGITQPWFGNVWMNPPYSQPLINHFADRLVVAVRSGNVRQACVLVNNATDTRWFQKMLKMCDAICLIEGRVRFLDPEGNPSGAPLQGQAVLYFGGNTLMFQEAFESFGVILHA